MKRKQIVINFFVFIMKSALLWASLLWPASMLAADNNVEPVLPLAQLIQETLEQDLLITPSLSGIIESGYKPAFWMHLIVA